MTDAGCFSGIAAAAGGAPGLPGGWSGVSGVTGLSLAADVSGGAFVAVSMSLADASLPAVTLPSTSALTRSALP
ncbi:hypothetical protein LRE75_27905, partial [Streptomyces sp. 372A]